MPYRKRNFRRKYYRRKGKKLSPGQRRAVKSIINKSRELKYFPYSLIGVSVTSTGALTGVPFDVPQGDTDNSRDGDQFDLAGNISFRFQLLAGDTTNLVRIFFFQWKALSTSAPLPALSDILLNGPSGSIDVWSQYNHDTRKAYKILWDRTYNMVGNGTSGTFPGTTTSQIYKSVKVPLRKARRKVQLRGGGGQGTNRIFMVYLSDSGAATHPTLSYSTKLFFYDS